VIEVRLYRIGTTRRYLTPPADIYETESEVVVVAEMPGVPKEDVEVNATNNRLTILGRVKPCWTGTKLIRECPNYDYYRAFTLSDAIDVENIQAKITEGVLTLNLPKKPSAQTYSIPIETE